MPRLLLGELFWDFETMHYMGKSGREKLRAFFLTWRTKDISARVDLREQLTKEKGRTESYLCVSDS